MHELFSEEYRRDPYPLYAHFRASSPLLQDPHSKLRLVFDYATVKQVLTDHEAFSSRMGPDWIVFVDPPRHTQLRALIAKAFTPKSVANLEGRIGELSRQLLEPLLSRGEMDLAADYAVPLPMSVIAEMLGVPPTDRARFERWNDAILAMSLTIPGGKSAGAASETFRAATEEMSAYLAAQLDERRAAPRDDLLSRLVGAEVDGEKLASRDILGFFQGLLVAGSETTTNLINNAILCFLENPDQLALLRDNPALLPSAIEEVLRYRSPLQWMFRLTKKEVQLHGQTVPAGSVVLAMMGSANHDPDVFAHPNRFDITRDPNPHVAFGHGIHFCMGAPLARLEAKVALTQLLSAMKDFRRTSQNPWIPRAGLHVHGPAELGICFEVA
jgi:cytochrome P450